MIRLLDYNNEIFAEGCEQAPMQQVAEARTIANPICLLQGLQWKTGLQKLYAF